MNEQVKKTPLILPKPEGNFFLPEDRSCYFHLGWKIHGQQLQTSQKGNKKVSSKS